MADLFETIKKTLESNLSYIGENGQLLKSKVATDLLNMDENLLEQLINNDDIRKGFFVDVNGTLIFDKERFLWLLESKQFLPNSYTSYKNKIGLSSDNNFISKTNEVVLNFPYKDSVLVGEQTKDDQKSEEIMFHEVLAHNDISNLLAPKVLVNAKRYTQDGVERDITFDESDNLIIKGNNLIALASILDRFKGKIQLIYIDPPYNTGSDSFQYNDNFSHSTWLTFMKNRLEIAKELLSDEGIIVVQVDYHENSYLRVLMDEIFGREKFVSEITVQMSTASGPKMAHIDKRIPKLKDSLLIFKKDQLTINKQPYKMKDKWDTEYSKILLNFSMSDRKKLNNFLENNDYESAKKIIEQTELSTLSKEYPEFKEDEEWLQENAWRIVADKQNTGLDRLLSESEKFWKGDVSLAKTKKGNLTFFRTDKDFGKDTRVEIIFADENLKEHTGDIWTDISTSGGFSYEGGINFPTAKKPEKLVKRIIEMFSKEDDIVLDFFGGSFTTAATSMKLNRKFISIEQMEYIEDISVQRLKNVINGDQTGISKEVDWQGGGSFVYCELLENSMDLIDEIQKSDETKINKVKNKIYNDERIVPYVQTQELERVDEEFNSLSLENKKTILIELIDKNKLYVPYSSINDIEFDVSENDKKFNISFYEGENNVK